MNVILNQTNRFSGIDPADLPVRLDPDRLNRGIVGEILVKAELQTQEILNVVIHLDIGGVPGVLPAAQLFADRFDMLPVVVALEFHRMAEDVEEHGQSALAVVAVGVVVKKNIGIFVEVPVIVMRGGAPVVPIIGNTEIIEATLVRSGVGKSEIAEVSPDLFVIHSAGEVVDTRVGIGIPAGDDAERFFDDLSALVCFGDAADRRLQSVCYVGRPVDGDLVTHVDKRLHLSDIKALRPAIPRQKVAENIKGTLHSVVAEYFGKAQIVGISVIVAEGQRLCSAARKAQKDVVHVASP